MPRSWDSRDRKSTRLNSSHGYISYAVFCLKKKKTPITIIPHHPDTTTHAHLRGTRRRALTRVQLAGAPRWRYPDQPVGLRVIFFFKKRGPPGSPPFPPPPPFPF